MIEARVAAMLDKAPGKALIRKINGEQEWIGVMEHVEQWKNKIPNDAFVKLSFNGDIISHMKEVDADGKDKVTTPSKSSAKSSSSGGGWGKEKQEFEREKLEWEKEKNKFIVREASTPHALEAYKYGVEKGYNKQQRMEMWAEVLEMGEYAARKITAEIQGGMKV